MDSQNKILDIADMIPKFNFKEIWEMEGDTMQNLKKEEIAEESSSKELRIY